MLTVKLTAKDFKSPAKWAEIKVSLELPPGGDEAIITRIPGLLPVEPGAKIDQNIERPPVWLLADDVFGDKWYLIHTIEPRFICRVADEEEEHCLSPFDYETSDGQDLCHFIWFDNPPEDLTAILNEAEQFMADYDERCENETDDG